MRLLLLVLLPLAAFAGDNACNLPADQGAGSLYSPFAKLPVNLVLDHEFYAKNRGRDAAAITRAVATWNGWAVRRGFPAAFVIVEPRRGMDIPASDQCSQTYYTNAHQDMVGIWKISNEEGAHANERPTCGRNADGTTGHLLDANVRGQTDWLVGSEGKTKAASILLNFDDYNRAGKPVYDLESEALHELGHVLGLLHSCNGSSRGILDRTTAVACESAPQAYKDAVMFPFLSDRELRTHLSQNDIDRINCLY